MKDDDASEKRAADVEINDHEGQKSDKRKKEGVRWTILEEASTRAFFRTFKTIGSVNGRYPLQVLCIAATLLVGLAVGYPTLLWSQYEADLGNLWGPVGSRAEKNRDDFEAQYGEMFRFANVLWSNENNALTDDILTNLLDLESQILDIEVERNGVTYKYTDLCNAYWTGGPCMFYSPLDFWQRNSTKLAADINANKIRETVNQPTATNEYGIPVLQSNIIGSLTYDSEANIVSGKGLLTNFLLSSNETMVDVVKDWEEKFRSLVGEYAKDHETISYATTESFPLENKKGDLPAFILGVVGVTIIVGLIMILLHHQDPIMGRKFIGAVGITFVTVAVFAGLGFALYIGHKITPISLVALFIILGVGVDSILLMLSFWDKFPAGIPLELKNKLCLGEAGAYVSVTTITTVLAFAIGTLSVQPAVSYFCFAAAFGIIFNFLGLIFVFNPLMVLDARRQEAGRADLTFKKIDVPEKDKQAKQMKQDVMYKVQFRSILVELVTPLMNSHIYRIFVILFFVGITGLFGYLFSTVKDGNRLQDVFLDTSYLSQYMTVSEQKFPAAGALAEVVINNVDWADNTVAANLNEMATRLDNDSYIVTGSVLSVWTYFTGWKATQVIGASDTVHSLMSSFLESYPIFTNDVKFNSASEIESIRMHMRHFSSSEATTLMDSLENARNIIDSYGYDAYPYAIEYIMWESYFVTRTETIMSMIYSGICVFGVLLLTAHPLNAVIVTVMIVMIDVVLLGWLKVVNLTFSAIAEVCLILCVGLVVDFAAHVAHAYTESSAHTRIEKSIEATVLMASNLLLGAISTFLAVAPLGFSVVAAHTYLFRIMVGVVLFGWSFGVIFLPVVLSYIGPLPEHDEHGDFASTALQQEFQQALQDLKPKKLSPKFPKPTSSEDQGINVVFEGAGSKCLAYIGVVKAMEENGTLKYVKKVAATGFASFYALLVSLGLNDEQMKTIMWDIDLKFLLEQNESSNYMSAVKTIIGLKKYFGISSGQTIVETTKYILDRVLGREDVTFAELQKITGRELCVIAMNVSNRCEEYFHVKTTPTMKVCDAISMACAYPLLVAPKNKGADMYIDAGYIANYPLSVFDGWFLSLDPANAFLGKIGLEEDDDTGRFEGKALRTIGFCFHAGVYYDVVRPPTLLASKFAEVEEIHAQDQKKQDEMRITFLNFMKVAAKHDSNSDGSLSSKEFLSVMHDPAMTSNLTEKLFGTADIDEIFTSLDLDEDGEISSAELVLKAESHNVSLLKPTNSTIISKKFKTAREYISAIRDTMIKRIDSSFVEDSRTCKILEDYIGSFDSLEEEDKLYLVRCGYLAASGRFSSSSKRWF
jgi:Niemann-Pick C1 protein